MSLRTLKNIVGIIGILLLIDFLIHAYLFYLSRSGYVVTIPLALGVQVSMVSFLVVVGSLIVGFFGVAKLEDIERKAMECARAAAEDAVRKLAEEKAAMVPGDSPEEKESPAKDALEGQDESEIE